MHNHAHDLYIRLWRALVIIFVIGTPSIAILFALAEVRRIRHVFHHSCVLVHFSSKTIQYQYSDEVGASYQVL
jgi:hypothetical protein